MTPHTCLLGMPSFRTSELFNKGRVGTMCLGVPGKQLAGGFLRPMARSNSVSKEEQKCRFSAPTALPRHSLTQTATPRPHRLLLRVLKVLPQTREASTSQFPWLRFTLPGDMHSNKKGIRFNGSPSSPLSSWDPSLAFPLWVSHPTVVSSVLGCQGHSLAPDGAMRHQTYYTPL